jgi:hypothetical protein
MGTSDRPRRRPVGVTAARSCRSHRQRHRCVGLTTRPYSTIWAPRITVRRTAFGVDQIRPPRAVAPNVTTVVAIGTHDTRQPAGTAQISATERRSRLAVVAPAHWHAYAVLSWSARVMGPGCIGDRLRNRRRVALATHPSHHMTRLLGSRCTWWQAYTRRHDRRRPVKRAIATVEGVVVGSRWPRRRRSR